jgi:hypothetical protein
MSAENSSIVYTIGPRSHDVVFLNCTSVPTFGRFGVKVLYTGLQYIDSMTTPYNNPFLHYHYPCLSHANAGLDVFSD